MRIDLPTCGLKTCKYCFDGNCVDKRSYDRCEFTLLKNKTLSVDAVPVVRCRECIYCDPERHICRHYMGTAAPLRRKADDFCSYGERKDGDGDA